MAMKPAQSRIARNGFRNITASLREQIEGGEIEPGRYIPTEKELQTRFGASRATIRKALEALIQEGWAAKVPHKGVVATRAQKTALTSNIALIDSGSYVLKVLGARFGEMFLGKGLNLVQMGGSDDYPMEYALQQSMDRDFVGSLVWSYRGFPDVDVVDRAAKHFPIVALDHTLEGAETDLVTFDYESAVCIATEHLAKQGCKRIAVVGMMDMLEISHQRFRGYLRGMFANGLQPESRNFIFTTTSGMPAAHDTETFEWRLRAADRPDGVVVMQDSCISQAIEAAIRVGLSLPNDLKWVTIGDDIDLSVDGVGMTAVALDWETLAVEAVSLLTVRLQNPDRPRQVRYAPHRLVVRGLCGAPRHHWTSEPDRVRGFRGELPVPRSKYVYSSLSAVQSGG